ncbi:MAG: 50S ribosomal protein L6 [Aerococcus sp.]|nr:50S ribosomal protein L6 [Aerococcus sp.]
MSRVGLKPIEVPAGVTVEINGTTVTAKGPKGELSETFNPKMEISMDDSIITVSRQDDSKEARSLHGTTRSLINNMVEGVHTGFEKKLELTGVGYRAELKGKKLVLHVGLSHDVEFEAPEGIEIEVPSNTDITIKGADKDIVGQLAANIRATRLPEPYKGKGIHYLGEHILRKEGKTGK